MSTDDPARAPARSALQSRQWWIRRLPIIVVFLVVFGLVSAIVIRVPPTTNAPSGSSLGYTKASGLCGGASLVYRVVVDAPAEIGTTSPARNTNAWRSYDLWVDLVVEDHDRCNLYGDYVGLRHADLTLVVYDDTQAFAEGEHWIIGQGATYVNREDAFDFRREFPSSLQADGGKVLMRFSLEWDPVPRSRLNMSVRIAVLDDLAQHHVGDNLRFALTFDLTISETTCIQRCWSPWSNEQTTHAVERATTVVAI